MKNLLIIMAVVGTVTALGYATGMKHGQQSVLKGAPEAVPITSDVVEVQCDAVTVWVVPNDKQSVSDADQIGEIIVLQDYCRELRR